MIKIDMEMPESCDECLFNDEGYCPIIGWRVDFYETMVYEACPLDEVEV